MTSTMAQLQATVDEHARLARWCALIHRDLNIPVDNMERLREVQERAGFLDVTFTHLGPTMKWTITGTTGMTSTVEGSATCEIIDGCLVFKDEDDNIVHAYARGEWRDVEGSAT